MIFITIMPVNIGDHSGFFPYGGDTPLWSSK